MLKKYIKKMKKKCFRWSGDHVVKGLDKELELMEQHIEKAKVNGENGWFLIMERHAKKGEECK